MNERFHMYRSRHLFVHDDCVGKFDAPTNSLRIFPQFADLGQGLAGWFRQKHGRNPQVIVGDEAVAAAAPPEEFPIEIRELMTPQLGDLTPEAVDWARENFSRPEFARRYRGRLDELLQPEPPAADSLSASAFSAPLLPGAEGLDPTGTTPIDAPKPKSERDRVREILNEAGVTDPQMAEDAEGGFIVTAGSHPGLEGRGETTIDAAQDFAEAIEYAEATKPAPKPEGASEEAPAAPVPAPVAKKAAKKAANKAAKVAEAPAAPVPVGTLAELEAAADAEDPD